MKTIFKSLVLVAVTASSMTAFAMSEEEVQAINTEGKIQAAMADQGCFDCNEMDLMEGKLAATAMNNMQLLVKDSEKQVSQIRQMGDIVGHIFEDSQGLIKFMGEKETFADRALAELKMIAARAESLHGDALFKSFDRATKLAIEIRHLNEEAQRTFDKANLK